MRKRTLTKWAEDNWPVNRDTQWEEILILETWSMPIIFFEDSRTLLGNTIHIIYML